MIFLKILNEQNGSLIANYNLLSGSFELDKESYNIVQLKSSSPKLGNYNKILNLNFTYDIEILAFSKAINSDIIVTKLTPSNIANEKNLTIAFPSLSQYVLNHIVINNSDYVTNKLKQKYPSFYYASYIQRLLSHGSYLDIGFISDQYLIDEIIKSEGLLKYPTTLLINGKVVNFTIECTGVEVADDFTGELKLSVGINEEEDNIFGYVSQSKYRTFTFSGFKKFSSKTELFLQNEENKANKFYLELKENTKDKWIKSLIKFKENFKTFVDSKKDLNSIIINIEDLNTILSTSNQQVISLLLSYVEPYYNSKPLNRINLPYYEFFYLYEPIYLDTVIKDLSKIVYDKTTSKMLLYFEMKIGISTLSMFHTHEFSFDIDASTIFN